MIPPYRRERDVKNEKKVSAWKACARGVLVKGGCGFHEGWGQHHAVHVDHRPTPSSRGLSLSSLTAVESGPVQRSPPLIISLKSLFSLITLLFIFLSTTYCHYSPYGHTSPPPFLSTWIVNAPHSPKLLVSDPKYYS